VPCKEEKLVGNLPQLGWTKHTGKSQVHAFTVHTIIFTPFCSSAPSTHSHCGKLSAGVSSGRDRTSNAQQNGMVAAWSSVSFSVLPLHSKDRRWSTYCISLLCICVWGFSHMTHLQTKSGACWSWAHNVGNRGLPKCFLLPLTATRAEAARATTPQADRTDAKQEEGNWDSPRTGPWRSIKTRQTPRSSL